jgi:DNA-binding MarR family transcriptional regulator
VARLPGGDGIGPRVLAAIAPEGTAPATLADRLGAPPPTVHEAVADLSELGLVEVTGDLVHLTSRGRIVATEWTSPHGPAREPADLAGLVRVIGAFVPTAAEHAAARDAEREALLAADADRDQVVHLLSQAFAEGRLSSSELEQRTGQALTARTYGELDDVLTGLADLHRPARSHGHPMRKALFWVVALLSTPFVLFGSLLLLGGSDADDLVAGLVVLVVVLPGVFALRRWAWPRA